MVTFNTTMNSSIFQKMPLSSNVVSDGQI